MRALAAKSICVIRAIRGKKSCKKPAPVCDVMGEVRSTKQETINEIETMKNLTKIALAAVMLSTAVAAQAETVRGYFRSNGTYVMPYYRTPANGTPYDNLSYHGYPYDPFSIPLAETESFNDP